jgi:gliding motility-associated-like protein
LTTGTVNDPKCYNDSNGSIAIIAQGGSIPYSYNWSNGQIGHTASNLHAGNYSVTISDINGCFSTFDTILQQPSKLITNKRNENIPCALACIGRAWANPQGGTLPYHWQWNDPNSQQTNPAIQLCDGVYTVIVTDANLCETTDTIEILDSSLYINFTAWADFDNIYEGERAFLHATLLGPAYHYQWTPSLGLSDANSPNPVASPKSTTTYEVLATDQYGCWYSDSITIYITDVICEEPYIYVPNAFTPNEDGQNDLLFVKSSVGWDLQFMIYDRWGELVFETEDINRGWDGKFNGKKLQAGVYVYHLKLTCLNHETFIKKGNITLIR